jgi:hypothetical protein
VVGVDEAFPDHLQAGLEPRGASLSGIQPMAGIHPPLPLQPQFPAVLGVQVLLDAEAHLLGEGLGVAAHDQVMVGVVHHRLGHSGRRADALQAGHAAGPASGTVHAA